MRGERSIRHPVGLHSPVADDREYRILFPVLNGGDDGGTPDGAGRTGSSLLGASPPAAPPAHRLGSPSGLPPVSMESAAVRVGDRAAGVRGGFRSRVWSATAESEPPLMDLVAFEFGFGVFPISLSLSAPAQFSPQNPNPKPNQLPTSRTIGCVSPTATVPPIALDSVVVRAGNRTVLSDGCSQSGVWSVEARFEQLLISPDGCMHACMYGYHGQVAMCACQCHDAAAAAISFSCSSLCVALPCSAVIRNGILTRGDDVELWLK